MKKPAVEYVECACGSRYGLHRWRDLACPNPKWRCGNGQRQWLMGGYVPYCFAPKEPGEPE